LNTEEYEAVLSFRSFWDSIADLHPKVIKPEFLIWAERYAGTGDLLIEVDKEGGREVWLIDLKTSQNVLDSHMIQLNAYFHAPIYVEAGGEEFKVEPNRMFILQLGYRRNKNRWKLTEVEDDMGKFEIAYKIWEYEHSGETPFQRDLPLVIQGIKDEDEVTIQIEEVAKKPKKVK